MAHGADDWRYFLVAIREALRARPSPNPPVGAVVARGGRILARGHHRAAGEPHAEVVALRRAGRRARGATLYTTLEPCNHEGRTPPCTAAIRAAGIREVVVGARDPNPRVRGGGIERLRRHGIAVRFQEPPQERWNCERILEHFATATRLGRPHVDLKIATTIDGRIATHGGESKWITSAESRGNARWARRVFDAILVGVGTVLADDPRLVAGVGRRLEPARVILDSRLRTPAEARLFRAAGGPVLVAHIGPASARGRRLAGAGAELLRCRSRGGRVDPADLLRHLHARGMIGVRVEGGSEIAGAFVDRRLVDSVTVYRAPLVVGGRDALAAVGGRGFARLARAIRFGGDDDYRHFTLPRRGR
jgi:diaminohydroxyphosphoribosylaminopyrimidine deaminase/5-amino-6-(5-phosphoribosylamino)uracil reductase